MKLYRIIDKRNKKPVVLGYRHRSSWRQFPTQAIQENISSEEYSNYYVEEFDMKTPTRILSLNKIEIK